jgi:hypothetical protein
MIWFWYNGFVVDKITIIQIDNADVAVKNLLELVYFKYFLIILYSDNIPFLEMYNSITDLRWKWIVIKYKKVSKNECFQRKEDLL